MQHIFASYICTFRFAKLNVRQFLPMAFLLLVVGFSGSSTLHAQDAPIGEWRTHLAFPNAIDVSSCEAFTVYATNESIVYHYHDNLEVRKLDKVNALSQANPKLVACNPYVEGQVIVLYEDGAIDILQDEEVIHYITFIADATIIGLRGMREISFAEDDLAFISTDFGFLLLDPIEGVIREDVRSPFPVNDVAVLRADLYVATTDGVRLLQDFRVQSILRDISQYENLGNGILNTGTEAALCIEEWRDEIYVGFNDKSFILSGRGTTIEQNISDLCASVVDITAGPNNLIFSIAGCGGIKRVRVSSTGRDFTGLENDCLGSNLFSAVEAPNGRISTAGTGSDGENGFHYYDDASSSCKTLLINSPLTSSVFDIDIRDGVVAVAAGGIDDQSGYTFNGDGVFLFRDNTWTTYNNKTRSIFARDLPDSPRPLDFSTVTIAGDQSLFAGAFFEGLVSLDLADSTQDVIFDELNSSLRTHTGDTKRVRVAGTTFDNDGNLWVSNFGAARPLSVRTPDGEWTSFSIDECGGRNTFRTIVVDENTGIAWIQTDDGVIAYDTKGTFSDTSDDDCRSFTGDNAGLPPADVKSMVQDKDGVIWVGSTNGIGLISCTGNPFDPNCNGFRPPVVVDGIPGFFFDGELIRSMEVDGGNRKWIGTDNGLFLIDDSGDEQLEFFTVDNSPLLDNKITSLAFDNDSGALWIGTDRGLMTLQTEATGSADFFFGNVEVYPQPVRPEYDGPIAIRGLATNSNVKITDAAGRLIFETDSIGGQAVWDGRDYTGRRPASGVYFVWATATEAFNSPEAVVAKIALLR